MVLDYETDEDAHFQCPECGQKGSVPKVTIEKALAETPHVHISCSNCAHKFEPFAPAEEENKQAVPSPLEAHWAQHDDDEDGGDADEEMADGNLPSWMMPVERPQTETSEPQEPPEENDTHTATDDDDGAVDEDVNEELDEVKEAALDATIADDMASKGADDPLDGPIADASPDASPDSIPDTPDDEVDEADEVSDEAIAADKSQESETEQAPQPTQEPIPEPTQEPTPAPSPAAPPIDATIETPPVKGPTGILNRLLGGLVLLLLAASTFVFIANRDTAPPSLSPSALSRTNIELQNAGFVRFSEDGEAGIEVSIRFKNPSAQIGVIGDFRIELQNEAGARLVHWTILSTGETVAPGQTRTLTSVLFGPPKELARVNIVYPLDE